MALSFIKKVEKIKEKNHTPIDPKKFPHPTNSIKTHTAVVTKRNYSISNISFGLDKYILLTIVSFLFFLSGLGFWIYVNYFMS